MVGEWEIQRYCSDQEGGTSGSCENLIFRDRGNARLQMKKGRRLPDNRALLVIGLALLPLGIAMANPAFMAVGLVFLFLGLTNRINGVRD